MLQSIRLQRVRYDNDGTTAKTYIILYSNYTSIKKNSNPQLEEDAISNMPNTNLGKLLNRNYKLGS